MLHEDASRKRLHPGRFGGLGNANAAAMIDGVGVLGVEIAERVVGQRGQMDHRIDALEIRGLRVAHVLADLRDTVTMVPPSSNVQRS